MFKEHWRKYLAEFIGTYALVFVGAGAVLASKTNGMGMVGVALAHGLVLMMIVYTIGHISGAHVNPAVTIAAWLTGHMKTAIAGWYVLAQLLGATFAALFLKLFLFPGISGDGMGAPALRAGVMPYFNDHGAMFNNTVSPLAGIAIEAMLTFFLVWAVMAMAVDQKNNNKGFAGLAIGLVLTFDILVGGQLTGAAMNPARAFGPTLVASGLSPFSAVWANQYVYWIGPILGALIAAFVYQKAFLNEKK